MKQANKPKLLLFLILLFLLATGAFFYLSWDGSINLKQSASTFVNNVDNIFEPQSVPRTSNDTPSYSFMIAGDAMFGRSVDYNFRDSKIFDIFSNLGMGFFGDRDLSLVNLEGPISASNIVANNVAENLIFNFPPKTPEALSYLGINAAGLANNHTYNQGQKGFATTERLLSNTGIVSIGKEAGFDETSVAHFSNKISVLAINCLETNTDLAPIIKKEDAAGYFVIIFPHWGSEYAATHSGSQSKLARVWIDAGADLVIGSHPHVMQDAEVYKGKPIFYSVGNFLFDQTFSTETQRGLIVAGNIHDNELELSLIPIKSVKLRPTLLTGAEKETVLQRYFGYFNKNISNQKLIFNL